MRGRVEPDVPLDHDFGGGNLDATLVAANSAKGAIYPPGSVLQLIPGFSNSFSCLSASASSGLTGLSQRGSVLCSARIIAGVTESGAQPWSVSHTRSHCGAAVR